MSLFIKEADIVAQGAPYFRIMFSTYIFLAIFIMVVTLFQSLGKATKASIVVLMRQVILFIPLLLIFANVFGIKGVWMAIAVNDGLLVLITLFMMLGEFRNLTNRAGEQA